MARETADGFALPGFLTSPFPNKGMIFTRETTVASDRGAPETRFWFPADPALLRYVVAKGSIAVDGVSLTVADVDEDSFSVALIPETLERTNLGGAAVGTPVNLEVDVLAKYVEKLVTR